MNCIIIIITKDATRNNTVVGEKTRWVKVRDQSSLLINKFPFFIPLLLVHSLLLSSFKKRETHAKQEVGWYITIYASIVYLYIVNILSIITIDNILRL